MGDLRWFLVFFWLGERGICADVLGISRVGRGIWAGDDVTLWQACWLN